MDLQAAATQCHELDCVSGASLNAKGNNSAVALSLVADHLAPRDIVSLMQGSREIQQHMQVSFSLFARELQNLKDSNATKIFFRKSASSLFPRFFSKLPKAWVNPVLKFLACQVKIMPLNERSPIVLSLLEAIPDSQFYSRDHPFSDLRNDFIMLSEQEQLKIVEDEITKSHAIRKENLGLRIEGVASLIGLMPDHARAASFDSIEKISSEMPMEKQMRIHRILCETIPSLNSSVRIIHFDRLIAALSSHHASEACQLRGVLASVLHSLDEGERGPRFDMLFRIPDQARSSEIAFMMTKLTWATAFLSREDNFSRLSSLLSSMRHVKRQHAGEPLKAFIKTADFVSESITSLHVLNIAKKVREFDLLMSDDIMSSITSKLRHLAPKINRESIEKIRIVLDSNITRH